MWQHLDAATIILAVSDTTRTQKLHKNSSVNKHKTSYCFTRWVVPFNVLIFIGSIKQVFDCYAIEERT